MGSLAKEELHQPWTSKISCARRRKRLRMPFERGGRLRATRPWPRLQAPWIRSDEFRCEHGGLSEDIFPRFMRCTGELTLETSYLHHKMENSSCGTATPQTRFTLFRYARRG